MQDLWRGLGGTAGLRPHTVSNAAFWEKPRHVPNASIEVRRGPRWASGTWADRFARAGRAVRSTPRLRPFPGPAARVRAGADIVKSPSGGAA
ncbi:hypothetical protein GCM10017600_57250 [Streptosporangium carneum]|uniref:Uncharacterized protein n=1 Tax=Streptosporangium carneum TaxID=47481 RepID=A0A9W6I5C2_9ACTN|nr:hypothetical protein GCM10017600_57250 [Streptosporangium carneum]